MKKGCFNSILKLQENLNLKKAYNKAINFYDLIKEEIIKSNLLYGEEDANKLKIYYTNLYKDKELNNFRRHYYGLRVMHLIRNIRDNKIILDAGCGTGSEAILCGILGGKIVGVDISGEQLILAQKRVKYYENKLNININIRFSVKNILNHFGQYDLIWANEAISHIDPIEDFFKISYNNLKSGGKLIIADANKLNPYISYLAKKSQRIGGRKYRIVADLNTGKKVVITLERIFSILTIKRLLTEKFRSIYIYPFGYYPPFIFTRFERICKKVEKNLFVKLPLFNILSGGYVAIAIK